MAEQPSLQLLKEGGVNAIVELPDGSLIIGGHFTEIAGQERIAIAKIKPDMTLDEDWDPGISGGSNPNIKAMILDGDKLYIGGDFFSVNGVGRRSIARLDVVTGKPDLDWYPVEEGDSTWKSIYSMLLSPDGNHLFVGGYFTKMGGIDINAIAKLSTQTGDADTDWNPQIPDNNSRIYAMQLDGNGLFIGGQLYEAAGQERKGIAKVSAIGAGALDMEWYPALTNNQVHSFALDVDNDKLYVSGSFSGIAGVERRGLARLNTTGTAVVDSWDPSPASGYNDIRVLHLDGGKLYVGGEFTEIGGQSRTGAARLSTTDATADSWNPGTNKPAGSRGASVHALVPASSGSAVYLGGWFHDVRDEPILSFAAVDADNGALVAGFNDLNAGKPGEIMAMTKFGETLYFGGDFARVNGEPHLFLARLSTVSGSVDHGWTPGFNDRVFTIAASADKVYAGGYFDGVNGQERQHLASVLVSDASLDGWNPGPSGNVEALLLEGNNLYVGGGFSWITGIRHKYLARFAVDTGALDATWKPAPDGSAHAFWLSGTDLFVGGYFNNIGGQPRQKLAKISTTGAGAAQNWIADADGAVRTLAVHGDDLFAGGDFKAIGGAVRNKIAKLNVSDATVDADWNASTSGQYDRIYSIAVSTDGTNVYMGGRFGSIAYPNNQLLRSNIAKVSAADATPDLQWNPSADADVKGLVLSDSGLYAGGKFNKLGGKTTALGHIVDGHLLDVNLSTTSGTVWQSIVTSNPEGISCSMSNTEGCSRAMVEGDIVLSTALDHPEISISQQWLSGCETDGGTAPTCGLTLDADKTVEVEIACELYDILPPDETAVTTGVTCNNIKATKGFVVDDGGKMTLTIKNSLELGPGFRVGNAPAWFRVRVEP
ncbi:delta-60 repeat domain-containing protein [Thiolapillus sp.]